MASPPAKAPKPKGQLEFGIERPRFPDRNLDKGGRSFYFFDLDDNILFLPTRIVLFHRKTGSELSVSTEVFARIVGHLGKSGHFRDYELIDDDVHGSFRNFRDPHTGESPLIADLQRAIHEPDVLWKGPSWDFFHHAVFNQRPITFITARGHSPTSLRRAMWELVRLGHLPHEPNYLNLYPVTYPPIKEALESELCPEALQKVTPGSVSELKRLALHQAVDEAMQRYGHNPHHRFGMSDDDPANVQKAIRAMTELKQKYTENAFYVFDSSQEPMHRIEVGLDDAQSEPMTADLQPSLF